MKRIDDWLLSVFEWLRRHLVGAYLTLVAVVAFVVMVLSGEETEAKIFTGAITVVAWVFVIVYALRSPWRLNTGGRALMYTSLGIAAIGTFMFVVWLLGDFPLKGEIRSVVLTGLLISMLHRLIFALRVQHWERHRDPDSEDTGFPG